MNPITYVALIIAAVVVLTMPVYALVTRGRPIDADVARRPTTFLLGYWIRDWLMWLIAPLERVLVAWRVSPDVFNYIGGVLGLLAGVAYARESLAVGGWLVLFGGLADIIDGRIARARGIGSNYGEFLDSMLDRFAEMFTFMGLAVYFEPNAWAMLVVLLASGSSMLVSYARAKGGEVNVECKGGVMQRAERLVLLAIASLLDRPITSTAHWPEGAVLLTVLALVGAGAFGTAVYRTVVISKVLKERGE